ncbi:MAG: ATP-binding protein [Candidatus Krumholzibacteriota bacterium]|nr:ATP-binding protein [Candidatus Krumholzibacteriota bacterium]
MLRLESFYSFLENIFDYLIVTNEDGLILYAGRKILDDYAGDDRHLKDRRLDELLIPSSLESFQKAIEQTRDGGRGIAVFSPRGREESAISLKTGCMESEDGAVFFFFGNKLSSLSEDLDWQKDERIKELTCLYNIARLIEVTKSIDEFFDKLPAILSAGMMYPEEVVVYAVYDNHEYGTKPPSRNYFHVDLMVWNERKGEIRVGYDEDIKILTEEQKMLDEIARMLNGALERKELTHRLDRMENEEAQYRARLRELKDQVANRTDELDDQKKKLSIVNSYLERVNKGWDKAKTQLETIFKAIPDEVVLLDTNRKVIMSNRDDIEPGDYCYSSFFGKDKPCENCRLAMILKEKTPVTLTIKDDDRYLQVHALPVYNDDHEVDGILEFYRDVTLEKTYDQQLQQADKLASIGELVSGIGHEINNPNQFIRGNIKIVKQSFEDMLPLIDEYYKKNPDLKIARLNYDFFREHIMVLVNDMAHGSERIKSIVEGLRAFTKKDEGLLVDTVEINALIEATTRLVRKEVHKKAEIKLELGNDLPTFKGNAQKIEQVLVNLIVNASQSIPDDTKGRILVRTTKTDSNLVVQIIDNGCGMNEKTMKQIFDPFFTTKRAKGGTGLGLAIVYRIIEEHGGKITVNSKPGVGTTFTIKIPAGSPGDTIKEKD